MIIIRETKEIVLNQIRDFIGKYFVCKTPFLDAPFYDFSYSVTNSPKILDTSEESDLDESIWTTDETSDFKKLSDDERKRKDVITGNNFK